MLQGMGLSSIPVGNSDAGSYFNNEVLAAIDYGVRPYLSYRILFYSGLLFYFLFFTCS